MKKEGENRKLKRGLTNCSRRKMTLSISSIRGVEDKETKKTRKECRTMRGSRWRQAEGRGLSMARLSHKWW